MARAKPAHHLPQVEKFTETAKEGFSGPFLTMLSGYVAKRVKASWYFTSLDGGLAGDSVSR